MTPEDEPPFDDGPPIDDDPGSLAKGRVGDARPPRRIHAHWADYTTRGNGERVVDAHGEDLRHTPEGGWLAWDGRRWEADPGDKLSLRRAMDTLRSMAEEAARMPGLGKAQLAFVSASQTPAMFANALKVASLYDPIRARFDEFDDGPRAQSDNAYRLCCQNGTLDLRTGELGPHVRAHRLTKLAGAEYRPTGPRAEWLAFLEAAQPDEERRAFLQRLAGYWLYGRVEEEVFPIFYGHGGNGKGTFLDTLRKALGDYAGSVPEDVMVTPGQGSRPHPTALMIFRGLRLAVASETNEGDTLAIATLKRLTGGDVIRARYMNKDFVEFEPTHKLVLMTNARPRLRGSVNASLRRRIFFVPWESTFDGARLDPTLKPRLASPDGLAAALAWCVEGFGLWLRHGLAAPASVLAATADYLADEDTLGTFLEDRCELGDGYQVLSDDLYKGYKSYCKEVGEQVILRVQDFKPALLAKDAAVRAGVTWKRTSTSRTFYGLQLRPKNADDYRGQGQREWTQ